MTAPQRILVFQTAFLGDVILTLPLIQILKKKYPTATIDVVTTPKASELLRHPAISSVLQYDKRGFQKGIKGIIDLSRMLRLKNYDVAFIPHRSLRSALVIALAGIPVRIGFSSSSGRLLYTHRIEYKKSLHEVERNLMLLSPYSILVPNKELPMLYPNDEEEQTVNLFLFEREILQEHEIVAIAPGSVWNTKRWLLERFAELSKILAQHGVAVMIIGGKEDSELGQAIVDSVKNKNIHDATGKLSLLESAELLRRCRVLVTNDSAPLHLGVGVKIPVVAIFGATVPEYGFAPYGEHDSVIETKGLSCRPCAIHGGNTCPIGTFDCMKMIEAQTVYEQVRKFLRNG